ncbi:MAG: hypothetical protein Q8K96_15615 [Rubrivivax sp.]|nr:hypothetical protein [Rubrivivax sp.]
MNGATTLHPLPVPVPGDGHSARLRLLLGGVLAALAALGLLLALGAAVKQVVRQAEARHANTAARADATWRCNNLAGRDERDDCRQRASGLLIDTAAATP